MTKKEYQMIAEVIAALPLPEEQRRVVARDFLTKLSAANPSWSGYTFSRTSMNA